MSSARTLPAVIGSTKTCSVHLRHSLAHFPRRHIEHAAGHHGWHLANDTALMATPRTAGAIAMLLDTRVYVPGLSHVVAALLQRQNIYAVSHRHLYLVGFEVENAFVFEI